MQPDKDISITQELIYEMKVAQVMTKNVITIDPGAKATDLQKILREKRISGVPVIENNQLVGLISIEDFIETASDGRMNSTINNRMSTDVKILYDTDLLVHAVQEFDHYGYGRFPVMNRKNGKLIGIITKGDIVRGLLNKLEIDYLNREKKRPKPNQLFKHLLANKSSIKLQYHIKGQDFSKAGESSSRLKSTLRRIGIRPQILRRIAVASYEAEMNIIIYTDGGDLSVLVSPKDIIVKAVDYGPGISNVKKALEPGYSTAPDWVRELGFGAGMGLPNIKRCSDEMNLHSAIGEGTRLEFIINLEGN
jgi:CBS domain-containing protein/anti-sigma regulatory factor (Ser/Thr protein kinase)